jgi:cytochrome P460
MMTTRHSILAVTLTLLTGLLAVTLRGQAPHDPMDLVDTNGNIRRPPDYRDRYQLLGVYTVLDAKGNEMHYTYASPGAADFYRKNGRFADGTVLVKEVLATSRARLTTGDAHWADSTKVWFVMMKDDKGRFPNNPLWGNGWGWALVKSDSPGTQVATDFKKDCLGCHIPAQNTDWIYVQGYPVLGAK